MAVDLFDYFPLKPARMHECCGAGRDMFALSLAAQLTGPIIWVRQSWSNETLNPLGMSDYTDPARLLVAQCSYQNESLAIAEEALREKAVSLVVTESRQRLSLTAGRRLQLAAKAGQTTGLALIQENMGSPAAETRWRCNPVFDPKDSTHQRWEIIKNKSRTLGSWYVRWDKAAHRLHVVSSPAG